MAEGPGRAACRSASPRRLRTAWAHAARLVPSGLRSRAPLGFLPHNFRGQSCQLPHPKRNNRDRIQARRRLGTRPSLCPNLRKAPVIGREARDKARDKPCPHSGSERWSAVRVWLYPIYPWPVASAELSRRVEKVVGYPPLSEMGAEGFRSCGSKNCPHRCSPGAGLGRRNAPMAALLCRACETSYYTATTGPDLERLARLGCEACGAAEPLRPVVRAVSSRVNGVKIVADEESEEREARAARSAPS